MESSHRPPVLTVVLTMQCQPLSASSTAVVHWLQSMNLHQRIVIIQSPQCTSWFTLGAVRSVELDKCIKTHIHYYSIIQNSFTALKVLCALAVHPSLSHPWQPLIFLLSSYICFSSMSHSLNYTVCSLFRLASFIQ